MALSNSITTTILTDSNSHVRWNVLWTDILCGMKEHVECTLDGCGMKEHVECTLDGCGMKEHVECTLDGYSFWHERACGMYFGRIGMYSSTLFLH